MRGAGPGDTVGAVSVVAAVSLVYLLGATTALAAAAIIWRRRQAPGATPLALMLVAAAGWAVCDAVELQVATAGARQLVSQIQYIGVVSATPLFLHGAVELAGRSVPLTPSYLAAVWGVPVLSLLAAWTNPWHHWLWTAIVPPTGDLPFATYHYGWWFWVLPAQHYLLVLVATIALLRAMTHVRRQFRVGMVAVLVAVVIPWVGNAAYNLKLGPWPGLNWLTLSLSLSGSLFAWAVLREGLLDVLPRARSRVRSGSHRWTPCPSGGAPTCPSRPRRASGGSTWRSTRSATAGAPAPGGSCWRAT